MKKFFSMAFACVVAAVAFTSCDKTNDNGGDDVSADATKTQSFHAAYAGDFYSNNTHNFYGILTEGITIGNTSIEGTGSAYLYDIISAKADNLYPDVTTYPVSDNQAAPSTYQGGEAQNSQGQMVAIGTYKLCYEAGELVKTLFVVSGDIKIEANRFVGNFTYNDGTKETIVYEGKLVFIDESPNEDDNYQYEPTTASTLNWNLTSAEVLNYGEAAAGIYMFGVTLENSNNQMISLQLFTASTTDINGTYPITKETAVNTCMASPGFDGQYIYPSFAATITSDGYVDVPYYLVSGNVTISATGITVSSLSYFGSTVNATYTGSYTITNATNASVTKAVAAFSAPKMERKAKVSIIK